MMRTGWICGALAALAFRFASAAPATASSLERAVPHKPVDTAHAAAAPGLDLDPGSLTRWTPVPAPGAAPDASTMPTDLHSAELRFGAALKMSWETPGLPKLARNFPRQGLPILPLWQNSQSLVALGLDRRGVLGLYLRPKSE